MAETLVDPVVTREKFKRDVDLWKGDPNRSQRGWVLLGYDEDKLTIEIAFMAKIATSAGSGFLPVVACAIRLTYENYDLWPPSLTFIDAFTREPARPPVNAIMQLPEGPRNVLIDIHPATQRPFLCLPGIREYHSHPQHTGDDWLLHRASQEGSVSIISERIWRFMVTNIWGLQFVMQAMPVWPLRAQIQILLAQGEFSQTPPAEAIAALGARALEGARVA
jgi:hypothetical protein